jgi:MFS superfamily sulfate permease-like transporter
VWYDTWPWSLPLILSTVIIHVVGLGLFNVKMVQVLTALRDHRRFTGAFALVIGITAVWATLLHAIEAGIWAAAYVLLEAVPDVHTAMLYSVSAITTYGHSQIFLTDNCKLLGALEALNGVILLGMTTALMYGLIQRVWPIDRRRARRPRGTVPVR